MRTLSRPILLFLLVGSVAYGWLAGNIPYAAFADATYDDAHFVLQAAYLLTGQWLGPYTEATLAKGPFFPAWVAGAWLLHVPLLVSEALLYAGAGWFLLAGVRRDQRTGWPLVVAFLLLLGNPMMWEGQHLRIMREGLYGPLTILVLALAAWSFRPNRSGANRGRLRPALAAGVAAGCFWLTREEGVWLLPSLFVLWLGLWLDRGDGLSSRERLPSIIAATLAAALGFAFVYGGVLLVNRQHYGAAVSVEFKQPEFLAAYGALMRVEPDHRLAAVPVTAEILHKVAVVSGSVASLIPALQRRRDFWAAPGCAAYQVIPCDREWRGGWFMWALREAARDTGHYASAAGSRAFYAQVAAEVNDACADGRLICGPERQSLLPPIGQADLARSLRALGRGIARLANFQPGPIQTASRGALPNLQVFFDLVEGPHLPAGPSLQLRLLATTPSPITGAFVAYGGANTSSVQLRPVEEGTRIDLGTDCRQPDCRVSLQWQGGATDIPIRDLMTPGRVLERGGARVTVENAQDTKVAPALPSVERGRRVLAALAPVESLYQTIMPVLAGLGLLSLVWQVVIAIRRRKLGHILLVQLALWIGIAARLVLLAVLDATVMPGINPLYFAPLYPMLLAAVGLAIWHAVDALPARTTIPVVRSRY